MHAAQDRGRPIVLQARSFERAIRGPPFRSTRCWSGTAPSGASAVKAVRDMKPGTFSITRLAAGAALMAAAVSAQAFAADKVGQPTDGAIDFQPGVTKLRLDAMWFHSWILL